MKTIMSAKRLLALLIALVMCLSLVGCMKKSETEDPQPLPTTIEEIDSELWKDAVYTKDTVIGEGATTFYFEVVADGYSITFTVNTDKTTVGAALLEHGIIAGDESQYGLYVKTVNGIYADYDVNNSYWSFTKDDEMMMTGVDGEDIENGAHYEMVYTKG